MMIRALISAILPGMAAAGGGHAPGGFPYEWAGIFNTPDDSYTWIAQKATVVNGVREYADATMKFAAIKVSTGASRAALGVAEPLGKSSLNLSSSSCTVVQTGATLVPLEGTATAACYQMTFDQSSDETTFSINAQGANAIAFFTEHVPTEFEHDKHYLKDVNGEDIEPVAQPMGMEGHAHDHGHGEAEESDEEEFGKYCVCQAASDGWAIDCSNMQMMNAAVTYMHDNEASCLSLDPSQQCINQYHVIQAHHDHCLHHDLPADLEKQLHEYEMFYQDCFIQRQYDPDLSQCPSVTCTDSAALASATNTLLACDRTVAACAAGTACAAAVKTVLMAHDTCPEDDLPEDLETGLHNYETPCASQLCNAAVSATFNPYDQKCAAGVDGASRFASPETLSLTTLALALAMFISS